MQIGSGNHFGHLTYCTNVHPAESWPDVLAGLRRYLPEIKSRTSPNDPFGVGLRLSALASKALCDPETFAEFQEFLADGNYYIFTINGFPYGAFHGQQVKEGVYRPDWADPARLGYTNTLADLLVKLLPKGMEGSISTVPGTFKPWVAGRGGHDVVDAIVENLIRHVAYLVKISEATGKTVTLGLEPEPFCLIETIAETISFFQDRLHSEQAVLRLAGLTGQTHNDAAQSLHRHLGVCLDVCHAAVEFENPRTSIQALKNAGIKISKLQLSSALRFPSVDDDTAEQLKAMEEPVYLHQVVENRAGKLIRYADIAGALQIIDSAYGSEMRVHFHVPVFLEKMQAVATTQEFLKNILAIHAESPITEHLEVETYTWNVLPDKYRRTCVSTAIARELTWVREQLN